jgi:endonuclease/exonuclease/phosphatase family metal-dependent hydrolase
MLHIASYNARRLVGTDGNRDAARVRRIRQPDVMVRQEVTFEDTSRHRQSRFTWRMPSASR